MILQLLKGGNDGDIKKLINRKRVSIMVIAPYRAQVSYDLVTVACPPNFALTVLLSFALTGESFA